MDLSDLRNQLAELQPRSFGWAMSCSGGDIGLAEDILQLSCLKVLNGNAKFVQTDTASFATWFFGVIRLTAKEEKRRHHLRRLRLLSYIPPSESFASACPDKLLIENERAAEIRKGLNLLSSRQQEVLHLVFYEDFTIEEASIIMAISIGAARQHYSRGKERLRKWLAESK